MTTRRSLRWQPLRFSLWFAAGFVLLRMIYRVVFAGAGGTGALLLDWPVVHLSGPFSTVALFGPVTTGGLWAACVSALPFAAIILASGLLFSLIDVRKLLTLGGAARPGRSLATALAIGLASYPALARAARQTRWAMRMRGLRPGIHSVSPLLSRTVEYAVGLAAALEVRGYSAGSNRPDGMCAFPVEARHLSLSIAGRLIIEDAALSCETNSLTLVTGATGSGKSTLLRALAGLTQHVDGGVQTGMLAVGAVDRMHVRPRSTAGFVSYVGQDVRLGFIAATVAEELMATGRLLGLPRAQLQLRAADVAHRLGLEPLIDRSVVELSAGEATLVAIAAALVTEPTLLLLDEPLSGLDALARERVISALTDLRRETGIAVIVAEHDTADLAVLATQRWNLAAGRIDVLGPIRFAVNTTTSVSGPSVSGPSLSATEPLPITTIVGPNGIGKTTLLTEAARLLPRARIGMVPEQVADLFITPTLAEELQRSDRASRAATGRTRSYFESFAGACADDVHPRDLSAGQQMCLALAIQLARSPELLLLDEPTRGLDPAASDAVTTAIRVAASKHPLIIASHDTAFVDELAGQVVDLTQRSCGAADLLDIVRGDEPADAPAASRALSQAPSPRALRDEVSA